MFNPYVLLGVLLLWGASIFGAVHVTRNYDEGQAAVAQQDALRELTHHADLVNTDNEAKTAAANARVVALEARLLKDKAKQRVLTDQLKAQTHAYITPLSDARCVVPAGFVELFNRSVRGAGAEDSGEANAAATGQLRDTPSGVALSAVGETVVDNHDAYWSCRKDLEARDAYIGEVQHWYQEINNQPGASK